MEKVFVIAFGIIIILLGLLFLAAEWRIFSKAGEKGWKSLVPFYGLFISHHIVGMSHVWFILEIVAWIAELMFEMIKFPEAVVFWFGIVTGVFTLISGAVHLIKMCRCFSKGTGFKIGMLLIPELFLLILAFGKAEYQKPKS